MEQTVGYHFMKNNHVTDTTLVMDLISQRTPAAKAIGCGKCGTNAVPNDVVKRCSCANSDGGSKHNSRSKGIVLTCMVKVDLIRVVTGTAFPCSCVEGFGFVSGFFDADLAFLSNVLDFGPRNWTQDHKLY
jgi:hypothetical protein